MALKAHKYFVMNIGGTFILINDFLEKNPIFNKWGLGGSEFEGYQIITFLGQDKSNLLATSGDTSDRGFAICRFPDNKKDVVVSVTEFFSDPDGEKTIKKSSTFLKK